MLFDLSPYLPFEAFVVLWLFVMVAIASYGEWKDRK